MASFAGQARREVRAAYRPAYKAIGRQEKRVRAMGRKQARDDAAFQAWLKNTNAQLNSEQQARDTQLQGVEAGYNQQLREAMGGTFAAAQDRAAQAGGGGQPGGSGGAFTAAMGHPQSAADYDPLAKAGEAQGLAQSAAYGGRLAISASHGGELSRATEANSYAKVAQIRAQKRVAIFDALTKLADQRGDLHMKEAAERSKRQAELEAAAAKEAQQRFQNSLALSRLQQGDERIAQGDERLAIDKAATGERLRQGRVRNNLARRRLKQGGKAGGLSPSESRARAKQIATATAAVENAKLRFSSNASAVQHYGSGAQWKNAVRWLVSQGIAYPVAVVAIAKYHGHGTDRVPTAWKQAIQIQSG